MLDSLPPEFEHGKADALSKMSGASRSAREWTYANCWNLSDGESAALWGLYVPASGGVAIQSTFKRLVDAFVPPGPRPSHDESDEIVRYPMYIGKITYVDYEQAFFPYNNFFLPVSA